MDGTLDPHPGGTAHSASGDAAWLTGRFEDHRAHLGAVALRMLGSRAEADDAVQEAWLRLNRADTSDVTNLGGWLTTVVARVCLDMLRTRSSRREEPVGDRLPEPAAPGPGPEGEALLGDSVGLALQVVLDTLTPAERLAFVLHDMFAVPFDEIAPIVGRTPTATRKLASRARQRVQGSPVPTAADLGRRRAVVEAFLTASRTGDFDALLALLDPDVVLRADQATVASAATRQAEGAPRLVPEVRGGSAVAGAFVGRARAVVPVLIGGVGVAGGIGAAWSPDGVPRAVFAITVADGRITEIDIIGDPARLAALDVTIFPD